MTCFGNWPYMMWLVENPDGFKLWKETEVLGDSNCYDRDLSHLFSTLLSCMKYPLTELSGSFRIRIFILQAALQLNQLNLIVVLLHSNFSN